MPQMRSGGLSHKHRRNYDRLIAMHVTGTLPGKIPEDLQETVAHIITKHRHSPEWYVVKQMIEDRFPKGTGYSEEKKQKPKTKK